MGKPKKMKLTVKNLFLLFILIFAATFALRSIYEIIFSANDVTISYTGFNSYTPELGLSSSMKNVATDRIVQKDFTGADISYDQKYEKTAAMIASTANFFQDNERIRTTAYNHEAVIQLETLTGLEGEQVLNLTIGVHPAYFDDFVNELKEIGQLKSFTVNKVDKTEDFSNLIAEQEMLQNTLKSYQDIKNKGGSIQDLLLVEDKIIEVETAMKNLGVDIDAYSSQVSLCTVQYELSETGGGSISVRYLLKCIKNSFIWTILFYGVIFVLLVLFLTAIWIIILLLNQVMRLMKTDLLLKFQEEDKAGAQLSGESNSGEISHSDEE